MTGAQPTRRTVGILIFDDVEVLDFCGPFEVFSIARADDNRNDEGRLFTVLTIAEETKVVRCRGDLMVQPHHSIADHPPLDLVVVPGGVGVMAVYDNPRLLDWIAAQAGSAEITTSVCTGAALLARRGLLDGKRATTHWSAIDWLREHYPTIDVVDNARFVDEGNVVTSAGVSAGIDMALHLLARLCSEEVAIRAARTMEYDRAAFNAVAQEDES